MTMIEMTLSGGAFQGSSVRVRIIFQYLDRVLCSEVELGGQIVGSNRIPNFGPSPKFDFFYCLSLDKARPARVDLSRKGLA